MSAEKKKKGPWQRMGRGEKAVWAAGTGAQLASIGADVHGLIRGKTTFGPRALVSGLGGIGTLGALEARRRMRKEPSLFKNSSVSLSAFFDELEKISRSKDNEGEALRRHPVLSRALAGSLIGAGIGGSLGSPYYTGRGLVYGALTGGALGAAKGVAVGGREKTAGVGWDLHGYHADPGSHEKDDYYESLDRHRIKTKFDGATHYKLNDSIAASSPGGELWEHTTDFAYGPPAEVRLDKERLRHVLSVYKQSSGVYKDDPHATKAINAFLAKGEALLKHPKFKFARLEYE